MATNQDEKAAQRTPRRGRKAAAQELRRTREELRLVTADRDAAADTAERLARHLDIVRAENAELRERLALVCREPIETDGLSTRMLHLVELAHLESEEIIEDAKTLAKHTRESAGRAAKRLRGRYEQLVDDVETAAAQLEEDYRERVQAMDDRGRAMEDEHARVIADAKSEMDKMARETDAAARAKADQLVQEAAARAEALVDRAAERDRAARAEAQRIVGAATEQADEMINSASARVQELDALRRKFQGELTAVRETLAAAILQTEALPGEGEIPAPREEEPHAATPSPPPLPSMPTPASSPASSPAPSPAPSPSPTPRPPT